MSLYLTKILDHIGFSPRPQQVALYEALIDTDETGTVAQAGTGTGKSIATLAAGAHWRSVTGLPSLIVVPMNSLLKQYIEVDAPRVEAALGITIRSLMGRNRYLCEAAPGFDGLARMPEEFIAREVELNEALAQAEVDESPVTLSADDAYWFGCPGRDEGCDTETRCSYRLAKSQLADADIIITNAHLLVLHNQLRAMEPVKRENEEGEEQVFQPAIFPDYGALFVDECHTLEDVLRGFATRSIPLGAVASLQLGGWLKDMNRLHTNSVAVDVTRQLVGQLRELKEWKEFDDNGKDARKKHEKAASEAAAFILQRGQDGAYTENQAVLWFSADHPFGRDPRKPQPKLVSTQINLAGGARNILTRTPFGLVSGTVPQSLRGSLGIPDARFVDCGHPFDYGRQGKIKVSKLSGAFKAVKNDPTNEKQRAKEVLDAIVETGGGTLVLFSSYKDMQTVELATRRELEDKGFEVRVQTREGDNAELGRWFKEHGNAVLMGTETFATGFDVPGEALRQVIVWKLPYPGLDPVTRAIMARSRQRYEDMMRMKVTQAVGRLIRTTEDTGSVFIVDSRAENIIGDDDPMLAHLGEFQRGDQPKRVRAWDIE